VAAVSKALLSSRAYKHFKHRPERSSATQYCSADVSHCCVCGLFLSLKALAVGDDNGLNELPLAILIIIIHYSLFRFVSKQKSIKQLSRGKSSSSTPKMIFATFAICLLMICVVSEAQLMPHEHNALMQVYTVAGATTSSNFTTSCFFFSFHSHSLSQDATRPFVHDLR
jgi:hypothetical protein